MNHNQMSSLPSPTAKMNSLFTIRIIALVKERLGKGHDLERWVGVSQVGKMGKNLHDTTRRKSQGMESWNGELENRMLFAGSESEACLEQWREKGGQIRECELIGGHRCTNSIHLCSILELEKDLHIHSLTRFWWLSEGAEHRERSLPEDGMEALRNLSHQFLSHGARIRTRCFDPWILMKKPF